MTHCSFLAIPYNFLIPRLCAKDSIAITLAVSFGFFLNHNKENQNSSQINIQIHFIHRESVWVVLSFQGLALAYMTQKVRGGIYMCVQRNRLFDTILLPLVVSYCLDCSVKRRCFRYKCTPFCGAKKAQRSAATASSHAVFEYI